MQRIIKDCCKVAFAEKDTATIPDWALEHVRLRESPYGNQFRASETPWLIEPLAAFEKMQIWRSWGNFLWPDLGKQEQDMTNIYINIRMNLVKRKSF